MNDTKPETKKPKTADKSSSAPAHVVREGAIAASIWLRQSTTGYPYYEFSLSRSWKNTTTGKTGYSQNFFARHHEELLRVIEATARWIEEHEVALPKGDAAPAIAA